MAKKKVSTKSSKSTKAAHGGFNPKWPVLRTYSGAQLRRLALPVGGIGTGTVSLGGRGDLRDWEVVNRPAKGFTPFTGPRTDVGPMLTLWAKPRGGDAMIRLIEGPSPLEDYEGNQGSRTFNSGMPRFRHCKFGAAYPLGQVSLLDPDVPVLARVEAFNPLVPGDEEASGIPAATFRVVLTNRTNQAMPVSVSMSVPNFVGCDGLRLKPAWGSTMVPTGQKGNVNSFRTAKGLTGIFMESKEVHRDAEAWGTLALITTSTSGVSHRTGWAKLSWGDSLLDFWDDLLADGKLELRDSSGVAMPMGSLCVSKTLPANGEVAITFLLTWHFPNRAAWDWRPPEKPEVEGGEPTLALPADHRVTNHYTTVYSDAWNVAEKYVPQMAKLEAKTIEFVSSICASDWPEEVKEAALFNVSTLRTQTVFRAEGGRMFGWEGSHDNQGSCSGSCTHVWNYEQTTPFLFGKLAQSMRDVEFNFATDDEGIMCFRVGLPLEKNAMGWKKVAADGQMGCIMKLFREWKLSGDDVFLKSVWKRARKSLEYCWLPGGWDADQDGVMEGCQHNTMDVEYYGPNPQMTGWYLGALRAGEEIARHLGERDFAARCHELFVKGSAWMDANLFNGDYYEHKVIPPGKDAKIRPEMLIGMGASNPDDPELQLGAGCLVDQMVGQYMAHVCGLGHLHDPAKAKKTAQSVIKFNRRTGFWGHFNHLRNYALGDEEAILMASYPRGNRPTRPFPYFNEVMTGFEYTAAVHLMYEGDLDGGLRCVRAIRERYDGQRRSPFNEAECGHHYARAMAAWAVALAYTGFDYDGRDQSITFAPPREGRSATWFWSNGSAWGTFTQSRDSKATKFTLKVLHGSLRATKLSIRGAGSVTRTAGAIAEGKSWTGIVKHAR